MAKTNHGPCLGSNSSEFAAWFRPLGALLLSSAHKIGRTSPEAIRPIARAEHVLENRTTELGNSNWNFINHIPDCDCLVAASCFCTRSLPYLVGNAVLGRDWDVSFSCRVGLEQFPSLGQRWAEPTLRAVSKPGFNVWMKPLHSHITIAVR